MSKYYKEEDLQRALIGFVRETGIDEKPFEYAANVLDNLQTIEVSEDCISRAWVQNKLTKYVKDYALNELDSWQNTIVEWIATDIEDAPRVTTEQSSMVGEWIACTKEGLPLTELGRREGQKWYGYKCSKCSFIYKGNALTESSFCQNCGAKMKGAE